jgi:hypothetical protein
MQNKALVYGVALVAVAVLALGAWMVVGKGGTPKVGSSTTQTQNTTLKNLIAMGGSNKCTFSSSTQNSQSDGVVYIANGQMRGDFTSVAAGKTIQSHMIVKDNTSYIWSDTAAQGFKMSFDAMATQNDANPQASVDPNAQVAYSCSSWGTDANMFVLPTNITFQDMSSLIPKGTSGANGTVQTGTSAQGVSAQCGACDAAPDAATKAQCRAALHC